MFPYGTTIEVLETSRDEHGDLTEALRGTIDGCAVAPESSTEDNDNRAQVDTFVEVYAPYSDVVVTAQDKVRLNGTLWHVEGDPAEWRSPFTGWQPGRVIRLRQVRG